MNQNDDVFQLVKSLNKGEKRFFRLFNTITGSDKHYMALFNLLDKQKRYNEDNLKTQLGRKGLAKNLSYKKIYLSKMLMRSLRAYHSEGSADLQLKALLTDTEILWNKMLLPQAEKVARKALSLSLEKEILLSNGVTSSIYLDYIFGHKEVSEEVYHEWSNVLHQQKTLLESLLIANELKTMNAEAIYLSKRYGQVSSTRERTRLKKMLANPLLSDKAKFTTLKELTIQLHLKGLIYSCLGMPNEEATINLQIIACYENALKKEQYVHLKNLINAISNYINCRLDVGDVKSAEKYLQKYDALLRNSPEDTTTTLEGIKLRDKMRYFSTIGDLKNGMKLMHGKRIMVHPEKEMMASYYYALLLFKSGKFNESAKVLHAILDKEKELLLDFLYKPLRLLLLMSYYETKDFELLHYRTASVKKAITKKKEMHDFEKALLLFFSNTSIGNNSKTLKKLSLRLTASLKGQIQAPELRELKIPEWVKGKHIV